VKVFFKGSVKKDISSLGVIEGNHSNIGVGMFWEKIKKRDENLFLKKNSFPSFQDLGSSAYIKPSMFEKTESVSTRHWS